MSKRQQDRQQRRSSDRSGRKGPPNSTPAFVGGGILLAILAGWFAWQWWTTLEVVRDGAPSWNSDGSQIVYYSEVPTPEGLKADLFVMNADGTGKRNITNSPDASEGAPAFSPPTADDPAGDRYLVYDSDASGNLEIYIRDFEAPPGEPDTKLTDSAARDLAPAWHPDGGKIVFMSDRSSPTYDLYELDVLVGGEIIASASPRRISTDASQCAQPDGSETRSNWFPQYSPDATRLAYHVCRDIHVMLTADSTHRQLTNFPFDGMYPSWSPDSEELVFMSRRNNRMELFRMRAEGSEQERLMTAWSGDAVDPRWSPDGDHIVFVQVEEDSPQADQTDSLRRVLYVLDLQTGRVSRVSR